MVFGWSCLPVDKTGLSGCPGNRLSIMFVKCQISCTCYFSSLPLHPVIQALFWPLSSPVSVFQAKNEAEEECWLVWFRSAIYMNTAAFYERTCRLAHSICHTGKFIIHPRQKRRSKRHSFFRPVCPVSSVIRCVLTWVQGGGWIHWFWFMSGGRVAYRSMSALTCSVHL